MDQRTGLTLLGMAGLVMLATGSNLRRRHHYSYDGGSFSVSTPTPTSTTASTTTSTTTAAPTATVDPADVPDPKADYTAIDDAKLDGNKANGKTMLLHVWRGQTTGKSVTLYVCGKMGSGGYLESKYKPEMRSLILAIPSTIPMSGCPRVVVKITGKQPYSSTLTADMLQILDLTPVAAPTLPPGVDYVSMDQINVDGTAAAGKIAQLKMYRGNTEEKKFTGYPCGDSGGGGLNFVYVAFGPEQKQTVKDLSTTPMTCDTVKVKLTTQQPYSDTWNVKLVDVVKGE